MFFRKVQQFINREGFAVFVNHTVQMQKRAIKERIDCNLKELSDDELFRLLEIAE